MHLKEVHCESIRVYRECKNVEKALLRHVQNAIEEKYIEHLLDEDTGLIEVDIPQALDYLFLNYGKVPSEEVKEKEAEVLNLSFNPAEPMVLLYRPIEQLQKLAISAGIPYSKEQRLEFGLTSVRNTRDFEKGLSDWNALPLTSKTWVQFKTHFKKAQEELKAIRGPTMQQAGYHHANMLAEQLRTTIDAQGTEMLAMLSEMQDNNPPIQESTPPPPPTEQSANSAAHTDVQLQILRILQDMHQHQVRPRKNQTGRTGAGGRGSAQRTGAQNRRTLDDATFSRRVTDKYCHTHGGCNHTSGECTRKAPGHEDTATMTNKLGGSNAFCTPAV
jgi:hypothetical protein